MRFIALRPSTVVGIALSFSAFISTASAGMLSEANCSGDGVRVTATSIDWTTGGGILGPAPGCINSGIGTNVDYVTGILGPGQTGSILDLPPNPFLPGFMTFNNGGNPVFFDLASLGPSGAPLPLVCAAAIGSSCVAFAGSPFVLTRTQDQFGVQGTAVNLTALGNLRNSITTVGTWQGAFTTQLPGRTPEVVIANINSGGFEQSTQSGAFITVVPEPGTITMSLIGGLLLVIALKRRVQA